MMENAPNALRVLVVSSMPLTDVNPVDIREDKENLKKAFANSRGAIEVCYLPHATVDSFQTEVHKGYDMLHFIGHGSENGNLIFEEKNGRKRNVSSEHFVEMLKGSRIELISLIACHSCSDIVADKLAADINALIAVSPRFTMASDAAFQFNKNFYNALACGRDIEYAFEQGRVAVASHPDVGDEICKARIKLGYMEKCPYYSGRFLLKLKENKTLIRDGFEGTCSEINPVKTPENIPQRVKGELFIGREAKMVDLNNYLEDYHIINLNGPPGVGKTSLAREVANWQHEKGYFTGGVIWHMTEADVSPDGLLRSLSKVLLKEEQIDVNKILNHLKQNQCLIIVDNFETVMEKYEAKDENAKQLVNFLAKIPDPTRILITSRRNQLGFQGEKPKPLEGLMLPDAMKLFIEIAERSGWEYKEEPENDRIIDNICTFLGGIPLAIELSAPLLEVKHLSLSELYDKLQEEVKLLKADRLGVPDRLKNYYASLSLSYRLLGKDAQKLFAMMSVFAGGDFGGAGREAIDKIIGTETGMKNWQDAMEEIEKHDLFYTTGGGNKTRWNQLPIIRTFAESKLNDFGVDFETLRLNHADYYLKIAGKYEKGKEHEWKDLDPDWGNVAAAADFLSDKFNENYDSFKKLNINLIKENKIINSAGDYAYALCYVVFFRHLGKQGERWLETGRKAFNLKEDKRNEGLMCNEIGLIHKAQGNYSLALEWYDKSVEIKEKIGDAAGLAATYNNIAGIHYAQGNYSLALKWLDKSVEINKKIGDAAGLATTYNNIGLIHKAQGNYSLALEWYDKSVEIMVNSGRLHDAAVIYSNMGHACLENKDVKSAIEYFMKSRDLYKKIDLKNEVAEIETIINSIKSGINQ